MAGRFCKQILKSAIFVGVASVVISGCGGSLSQLPVAEIKQDKWNYTVTLDEFEQKFREGLPDSADSMNDSLTQYRNFLSRYIDYRLKVKDAFDKGYDKKSELIQEYNTYRRQLAEPYLMEKEVIEKNLQELYEKQKEEIRAAHILALVPKNVKPADTLKAYQKIQRAKALLITNNAPFDSVALVFSDDPSVKRNKGELGYFSGGMMVHQFEDAAYQGKAGEVLGPIRTRYGYHLIKIKDRRKRTLPIRTSHIMVSVPKNPTPEDTLKAYQSIKGILSRLKNGEQFVELARQFSDDKTSGKRGGDLGFFGLNRMVKPFENAAFALKNIGDLSPIVRSPFGYHIIRLEDRQMAKSYEESKENLKRLFKRNKEKVRHENRKLVDLLKKRYRFKAYPKALAAIESKLDSRATYGLLDSLNQNQLQQTVMAFAEKESYTLDTLVRFLKRSGSGKRKLTRENYDILKSEFEESIIKSYEISKLDNRYPEFASLMKNYKEGILLYKISEDMVWSRTRVSDSLARAYYKDHQNDYRFGPRIEVSHISLANDSLASDLYKELTENIRVRDKLTKRDVYKKKQSLKRKLRKLRHKKDDASKMKRLRLKKELEELKVDVTPRSYEDLSVIYSGSSDLITPLETEEFEKGERDYLDRCFTLNEGVILAPVKVGNTYRIFRLEKKLPAMNKSFDEAKSEIFSHLQELLTEQLEKDWVSGLRQKSEINIYLENLNYAFQPKS